MATGLETLAGAVDPDVEQLLRRRFEAVDGKDLDGFLGLHAEDHLLVFGPRAPIAGRAEMGEPIRGFWSAIGTLNHDVRRVASAGDTVYVESVIAYERLDHRVVEVPCCDVFRVKDGRIAETRAYLDQSPIWAEIPD